MKFSKASTTIILTKKLFCAACVTVYVIKPHFIIGTLLSFTALFARQNILLFLTIGSKPIPKTRQSRSTIHTKGLNCFTNSTCSAVINGTIQYLVSTFSSYYVTVLMIVSISKLTLQTICSVLATKVYFGVQNYFISI